MSHDDQPVNMADKISEKSAGNHEDNFEAKQPVESDLSLQNVVNLGRDLGVYFLGGAALDQILGHGARQYFGQSRLTGWLGGRVAERLVSRTPWGAVALGGLAVAKILADGSKSSKKAESENAEKENAPDTENPQN